MTTPIDRMIESSMRCLKCGTQGMFKCDCHVQCSCGWIADKGKPCGNPETKFCSTKLKYAPAHMEVRKGERVMLNPAVMWSPVDAEWSRGYYGTVGATPRKGSNSVSVRWDGRTSCDRVRISWLEKV